MTEEKLISIDELIKRAKKEGISFGKADPYNRLRYYTKLALLPHMERRKAKSGKIEAYYPESAFEKLLKIEALKTRGLSNEEIIKELGKENRSAKKLLTAYITQKNILIIALLAISLILMLDRQGVVSLSSDTDAPSSETESTFRILDSGKGTFKAGKTRTFVKSDQVTEVAHIQVAFKNSISPAETFTIESKIPQEGFVLALDTNTAQDVEFSWWLTGN